MVFIGYHAGSGARGVLSHTYLENSITGVWLDGVAASEGRLNAALAAEYGVPVLMVTGDDMTCRDAEEYAADALTVTVKQYVSRYAAVCTPPARTSAAIREAARRAMRSAGRLDGPPVRPHRIEVEFDATHLADAAAVIPTVCLAGERRVSLDAPSMTEAMKAFKIVTAIAAAAVEDIYG